MPIPNTTFPNKSLLDNGADISELHLNATNPGMRDCPLSEKGIEECYALQPISNRLSIHTVFVSVLRRTLETAYNVFHTHPDFSSIKFVVLPDLREKLGGVWDIPGNITEVIHEFKEKLPNLDTKLIDSCTGDREECLNVLKLVYDESKFANDELTPEQMEESTLAEILIKKVTQKYPEGSESLDNVRERGHKVRTFIAEYLKTHKLVTDTEIDSRPKLVLLTHSRFLVEYLGLLHPEASHKHASPVPNWKFIPDKTDWTAY